MTKENEFRMKDDSIIEAMLEFRFETPEKPIEIMMVDILNNWHGYNFTRTALSEIPEQIRKADPNLRYAPLYEFSSPDKSYLIRLGNQSASLHNVGKYKGWEDFRKSLAEFTMLIDGLKLTRIGLRYVNFMDSERHKFNGISSMKFSLNIGDNQINDDINLQFSLKINENTISEFRIASKKYLATTAATVNTLVDLDIHTPDNWSNDKDFNVTNWLEQGHTAEKLLFTKLFKNEVIEQWRA